MTLVLDTHVVSTLRVAGRHAEVEAWLSGIPAQDVWTTAFTIAEIERGVARRERSDPDQGALLRRWFEERVLTGFAERVLPFDLAAARVLAAWRVPEHAPMDDALIAAVAHAADMTVVTRNVRHFVPLGVRCVDPWTAPR